MSFFGADLKERKQESDPEEKPLFGPGKVKKTNCEQRIDQNDIINPVVRNQHGQTERQKQQRVGEKSRFVFPPEQPGNKSDNRCFQKKFHEGFLEKNKMAHTDRIGTVMINVSWPNRRRYRLPILRIEFHKIVAEENRRYREKNEDNKRRNA